jgi:hypothetical protein
MFVISTPKIYEIYTNFADAHRRYCELCKSGKHSKVEMKFLQNNA